MPRILVVDDEQDLVDLIRFIFQREGHEVLEAGDGKAGFERATLEKPDLIILDIMMPEMDGYALNARLLDHPATKNIPVIVLTAKGHMQEVSRMAPNVLYHIEKPFETKDLTDKVQQILQSKTNPV